MEALFMKMIGSNWQRGALSALLLSALAACDSDTTSITIEDLQGVWAATNAELLSTTGDDIDLIALGATVTLVIQDVERYTLSIGIPNEIPQVFTGNFVVVDDNTATIQNEQTGNTYTATYTLDGNVLDMNVPGVEFTDPPDGIPDQATFEATFLRSELESE
jgi:hypothetical protein